MLHQIIDITSEGQFIVCSWKALKSECVLIIQAYNKLMLLSRDFTAFHDLFFYYLKVICCHYCQTLYANYAYMPHAPMPPKNQAAYIKHNDLPPRFPLG